MAHDRNVLIEHLEARTLFGAILGSAAIGHARLHPPSQSTTAAIILLPGSTLHPTAGVAFNGEVAFYSSPVLDPPLGYSASIDWGDGNVTDATLQYGSEGTSFGYVINGSHTYGTAGTFKVMTTLSTGPIVRPGQPTPAFPTQIVAEFVGDAIVGPASNSTGGVTISEPPKQQFTANVGSFSRIAPATGLHASIAWGDGTRSAGTVTPTGVIGIDVIPFDVSGTHAYARRGKYHIRVVVIDSSTARPHVVVRMKSTALVKARADLNTLAGTLNGTYSTPATNPDLGAKYDFVGIGSVATLADVSITGEVGLPGFIASAQATGSIVLTHANGSVALQLTGPAEAGFGPFPSTLSYVVTQSVGVYAGLAGTGTITVALVPGANATDTNGFTFVLT